jgi:hypothetical protein
MPEFFLEIYFVIDKKCKYVRKVTKTRIANSENLNFS